jgi:hypothetical protein
LFLCSLASALATHHHHFSFFPLASTCTLFLASHLPARSNSGPSSPQDQIHTRFQRTAEQPRPDSNPFALPRAQFEPSRSRSRLLAPSNLAHLRFHLHLRSHLHSRVRTMATTQELAKRYASQLQQLHAIFPSWDEGDLAFTLQDAKGNVDEAAMMITEGE